ncbi:MAG: DUF1028 domain-containing protein [Pirellulales bacterium]
MMKVARAAAILACMTVSPAFRFTTSAACAGEPEPKIATFSIVACDPQTGEVGAAVASMYPAVGKVVPYVKAGAGAFCTQHYHNPEFGPRALVMLETGLKPQKILTELLRHDPRPEQRQLGIIDLQGRTANHNPTLAAATSNWWGYTAGKCYAVQGNTLAGREVITAMAKAYEETEGTVADRLMAALKAGDDAGGDHRGRLAAGIRVDRPLAEGESPHEGVWLALDVDKSDNAVNDLLKRYEEWKAKPRDE